MREAIKGRRAVRPFVVVAVGLLLALLALVASPPSAHAATASNGAKLYTLAMQKATETTDDLGYVESTAEATYKNYDITNDGKADVLKICVTQDWEETTNATFYVNGRKALSLKVYCDGTAREYKCKLIRLKNKKQFLVIEDRVYAYKSGKLKEALAALPALGSKTDKYCWMKWIEFKSVSGNTVTGTVYAYSYSLGPIKGDFKYAYKNGAFKRSSNTATLYVEKITRNASKWYKQPTLKTAKAMTAYKSESCKSKKFSIPKGKSVKVLKMCSKGSVLSVQVKCGKKTGWIKMAPAWNSKLLLTNGAPPFVGLHNV